MRLIHLIDSWEYVTTNCFQHQLLEHLVPQATTGAFVPLSQVEGGIPEGDVILSTLKIRSLRRHRDVVSRVLGGRPLFVYDQDPWECFTDQATFPGAYRDIASVINVRSFINTSRWWSSYVRSQGFPSVFAPMWPLPSYCDEAPRWSQRPIRVGYKGSMHPHRMRSIEALGRMGIDVVVLPSGSYREWLDALSTMQFFVHDQAGDPWTISGRPIGKECAWAKDVEVAARGCFCLRVREAEAEAYHASSIPAMKAYVALDEVPGIIEGCLQDPEASDAESSASVRFIRSQRGWFRLADLLALNNDPGMSRVQA